MNLFPPFFIFFVISANELISGSDEVIGTMQPSILVEGNIKINDKIISILTSFKPKNNHKHPYVFVTYISTHIPMGFSSERGLT